jgi:hypothetical protein
MTTSSITAVSLGILSRDACGSGVAAEMPRDGDAWRLGLGALDTEAQAAFGDRFHQLEKEKQDAMLERMQKGELKSKAWGNGRAPDVFRPGGWIPMREYAEDEAASAHSSKRKNSGN